MNKNKTLLIIKPLKKYILKHRKILAFGLLLLFFNNLIQICEPIVINSGFNVLNKDYLQPHFLTRAFTYLHIDTKYDILFFFAILYILVNLIRLPLIYFHQFIIMSVSKRIECDLRNELFFHLQRFSLAYYHRQKTGDIMARLSDDIRCVDEFTEAGIALGNYLVLAPISIVYLYLIGKELVIYALIPLLGVLIFTYILSRYGRKYMRIIQKYFGLLCGRVQENLTGIRIIKSYVNEENEISNYSEMNKEYFRKNMVVNKLWSLGKSLVYFLIGLSQLIFLGVGCGLIISGRITSGNFAAFFYQLNYLTWPIILLGLSISLFQQALARMERINEIILEKLDIEDSKKINQNINAIEGEIELKNLIFAFEKDKAILRNISIRFEPGRNIGLIGNTGSGKSTFINLIARLYKGPEETIFIDKHPIEKIPLKILRSNIGYVPQEPFLFLGSIRDNISFGVPGASQETLDRVSFIADIKTDIDEFPNRYETLVGERGVNLSGGQKQRIAIARAVIIKPKILLLDNALSQVDADTEKKILKNLTSEVKDCLTIFVSNRIASIKNADLIVVLINGQIVETGTHHELLKIRGFYSAFFEKELMEDLLETA